MQPTVALHVPRRAAPRTSGSRAPILLTWLAAAGAFGMAQAPLDADLPVRVATDPVWGPALAYRTPASAAAERSVAEALADLRSAESGLAASATLAPSVTWRGAEGGDAEPARWRADVVGTVSARLDAGRLARARLDVLRAATARAERAQRDLREALMLHVDLQRAHLARTLAEAAATSRDETLADAEAADLGRDPGAPASTTLAAARLAAERAHDEVARSARAVAEAERRARAAGFDPVHAASVHRDRAGALPLEGWRLVLPDVAPGAIPDVARAALSVEAAAAALERAALGGFLDDAWLETSYSLPDVRLRGSLDLDEGRPGGALEVSLRSASRTSWTVGVGARLRIDEGTVDAIGRARAAHEDAVAAHAAATDEAPWSLAVALQAVADAEADVAYAERALAIGRSGLDEAIERWRDDGADGDTDVRARADAALARVAIGFERERDAFYRAWAGYLLEVERYVAVAGSSGGVLAPP